MPGTVTETYAAAIQHDLVDLDGATAVGVVRQPPGWFHATVDENVRELGPPEELLEETKQRQEDMEMAGLCGTGAHNAAWEETNFEERYREYLRTSGEATEALESLRERCGDGEDIALVCFEGDDKRCHRRILHELLGQS